MINSESTGFTGISNVFIDNYIYDANALELKVYLYLKRLLQENISTSIDSLADKFNETSKDVIKAILFWEKKGLAKIVYNTDSSIKEVWLDNNLLKLTNATLNNTNTSSMFSVKNNMEKREIKTSDYAMPNNNQVMENQKIAALCEQYFNTTLNPDMISDLFFIKNNYAFSMEVMDLLMKYCAGKTGKFNFKFMKAVADTWKSEGVKNVSDATLQINRHEEMVARIQSKKNIDVFEQNNYDFDELEKTLIKN